MDTDVYQAPATESIDAQTDQTGEALYVVSPLKFSLLFLATLGIYGVYWNYRNWKLLKAHRGANVIPVLRAIFSIIFFGSLLKHVNEELGDEESQHHLPVTLLTAAYVILNVISGVADRLSAKTETVGVLDFVSLVLLPCIWFVVLTAQHAINRSQGDIRGESNSQITLVNGIWLLLGLGFWSMILLGLALIINPALV